MPGTLWKVTIVVNNYVNESNYLAEHGISLFLEKQAEDPWSLLFDTGQTASTLLYNLEQMKLDINSLQAIVLSHGHYDHTGGLLEILKKLNRKIPVFCHPDIARHRLNTESPLRNIGIAFSKEELEQSSAQVIYNKSSRELTKNLIITGEIPRIHPIDTESVSRLLIQEKSGNLIQDNVIDDQSILIIKPNQGFYLICGCCHAGILNTLDYALKISPEKKLLGIIGGLHLVHSSENRLQTIIEHLQELHPEFIVPLHCSGQYATSLLWNSFGEKVKFLGSGDCIYL